MEALGEKQVPDQELVKVMIDKVVAEERVKALLFEYKEQLKKASIKVEKAEKALANPSTGPRSSEPGGYGAKEHPMTPRSTMSCHRRVLFSTDYTHRPRRCELGGGGSSL